jgi:hypothetical protein
MWRAALLAAWVPSVALAWPVDGYIDVPAGTEKIVKFGALDAARIDDPQIAEVEVMPETGELLVTARKPGRALVQLLAQGRSAVWRVRVGGEPLDEQAVWDAAAKVCKGVQPKAKELVVTIESDACRAALLKVLAQDRLLPKDMELTFGVKPLQTQLTEFQAAMAAAKLPVKLRYEGAGLILEGSVDEAARQAVYFELFKKSAGRLAITDRLKVAEAKPKEEDAKRP